MRKQREARELEVKLEKERKELLKKHAIEVKKQIVENSEKKGQEKKIVDIENQQTKEVFQGQKDLLERIKQNKINELKHLSVPEKYIVELENQKVN